MSLYGDASEDVRTNPTTGGSCLDDLVQARLSRRAALVGGAATSLAFLAPGLLASPAARQRARTGVRAAAVLFDSGVPVAASG